MLAVITADTREALFEIATIVPRLRDVHETSGMVGRRKPSMSGTLKPIFGGVIIHPLR